MLKIKVQIIYALSNIQHIQNLIVPKNTSVKEAIIISNILFLFKEINLKINKVGIFNKIVTLEYILNNNDRIEIYRKLLIDPKELRKQKIKK